MSKQKPLWSCPKCGNRLVTRNMWHSCGRHPLAGQPVRECGRFSVVSQKTRICFMVRVRFAGMTTRKHWLDVGLYLHRRVGHPLLRCVDSYAVGCQRDVPRWKL